MDDESTHVKRLLINVRFKPIELANYDAVVALIAVSVSSTEMHRAMMRAKLLQLRLKGCKTFLPYSSATRHTPLFPTLPLSHGLVGPMASGV